MTSDVLRDPERLQRGDPGGRPSRLTPGNRSGAAAIVSGHAMPPPGRRRRRTAAPTVRTAGRRSRAGQARPPDQRVPQSMRDRDDDCHCPCRRGQRDPSAPGGRSVSAPPDQRQADRPAHERGDGQQPDAQVKQPEQEEPDGACGHDDRRDGVRPGVARSRVRHGGSACLRPVSLTPAPDPDAAARLRPAARSCPSMLRIAASGAVSFGTVSHPSVGHPPRSLQAGFPEAAARLRASRAALAVRALEVAVDADPTMPDPL